MTDTQEVTDVIVKQKVKRPSKYNVVLLNDNATPMDFVVELLMSIFGHIPSEATKIMLNVHNEGKGIAGTYEYEIAEQKAAETYSVSQLQGFPLKVKVEPS